MSSHELAANESFQTFVFRKNEADTLFWEKFINLHPSKRKDVDQAVCILSLLSFKIRASPGEFKELELNRLLYNVSLSGVEKQTSWRRRLEKTASTSDRFPHAYGVQVIFSRDVNKNEQLAGTVPSESLDVPLSVLAKSSNLNIVKS